VSHFNAFAGVIPCKYFDKLCLSRNWNDSPTRQYIPHDRIFSFVWTKHWNVTDRRTDGQTNGQNRSDYYSGLHCVAERNRSNC